MPEDPLRPAAARTGPPLTITGENLVKPEERFTTDKRERSQQIADKYRRNAARRTGQPAESTGRKPASDAEGTGRKPAPDTEGIGKKRFSAAGIPGRKPAAGSGKRASAPPPQGRRPQEENSAPILPTRDQLIALAQDRRVQMGAVIIAALLVLFFIVRLVSAIAGRHPAVVETTTEEPTTVVETTTEEETEPPLGSYFDSMQPAVAITFDDGPKKGTTDTILDLIEQYQVHATFFIQGQNVSQNPEAIKRMVALGCELGNHTWDHTKLTKISSSERAEEISKAAEAIREASGGFAPTVFRPPYGTATKEIKAEIDIPVILWRVDSLDWKSRDAAKIVEEVRSQVKGGDIILLHDIHDFTVEATKTLIPLLKDEMGFKLLTVSELYEYYGEELTLHGGHSYAEPTPPTTAAAETSPAAEAAPASDAAAPAESAAEGGAGVTQLPAETSASASAE